MSGPSGRGSNSTQPHITLAEHTTSTSMAPCLALREPSKRRRRAETVEFSVELMGIEPINTCLQSRCGRPRRYRKRESGDLSDYRHSVNQCIWPSTRANVADASNVWPWNSKATGTVNTSSTADPAMVWVAGPVTSPVIR